MKVKAKKKNKNPYPKYSYNTGLRRECSSTNNYKYFTRKYNDNN
jgi:hypothetical protein